MYMIISSIVHIVLVTLCLSYASLRRELHESSISF